MGSSEILSIQYRKIITYCYLTEMSLVSTGSKLTHIRHFFIHGETIFSNTSSQH